MGFTPNDSEDVGSLSRSIDGMPEICLGFARLGDVDPLSWLYDAICEEFQDLKGSIQAWLLFAISHPMFRDPDLATEPCFFDGHLARARAWVFHRY